MQHLGKILPVDGYEVRLEASLPTDYLQSLMHLYQPLLGIEAISLYQLLLYEMDVQSEGQLQTHHTLMNYLNLPLDRIYEARRKLEGIGLLKTMKHETEEQIFYTYVLKSPFTPEQFFKDMMLSELLYRHIGKTKYTTLQAFYTRKREQNTGKNITAAFHDVFQTFKPTNNDVPLAFSKKESKGIPLEQVDFSFIAQSLKRKMIPVEKVLTEKNKSIISQLIHLYGIETYELESAINWALTDENKLDIEQLKAACHDLFQAKHNVANVKLEVKQAEQNAPIANKNVTKEERLIATLEKISPKELLEDLSTGNNASEQDVKLIRDLMISQGLPSPVMNVLIHYVLLQSDMKLSKAYLEKIASHWSRAKLNTAKEAMDFARKQTEKATQPRRNYQTRKKSTEIIPDWFKEREQQSKVVKHKDVTHTKEQEKEQAELIALLNRHASNNN